MANDTAWLHVKHPTRKIISRTERVQTFRIRAVLECGHTTSYTRAAHTPDTKKAHRCWQCSKEAK